MRAKMMFWISIVLFFFSPVCSSLTGIVCTYDKDVRRSNTYSYRDVVGTRSCGFLWLSECDVWGTRWKTNWYWDTELAYRCCSGYIEKWGRCEPVCTNPCTHGTCTAPEQCTCDYSYKNLCSGTNTCVPVCEPKCKHGTCTVDGCDCFFGWEGNTCNTPSFYVVEEFVKANSTVRKYQTMIKGEEEESGSGSGSGEYFTPKEEEKKEFEEGVEGSGGNEEGSGNYYT